MKRIRIIPSLLLFKQGLYKTVQFKNPNYIGDPINAVKIFNDKEVDEILVLDIGVNRGISTINYDKIAEIAGEAFMPMGYGGGINSLDVARKVFDCGYEKVVLNTSFWKTPDIAGHIANIYGSQSVVVSIDARKDWLGRYKVFSNGGAKNTGIDISTAAKMAEDAGAGELLVNAIMQDGTWDGYDLELISKVTKSVNIPVVASGGAGKLSDFIAVITKAGASAVSAGSMFVYQKKGMGVLISFPETAIYL